MNLILISKKQFLPIGETRHLVEYRLSSYKVKNGLWYMLETSIPDIKHHQFKCYRSKDEATKYYEQNLLMEQWRNDGCIGKPPKRII